MEKREIDRLQAICDEFAIFSDKPIEQIEEWIFFGGSFNPWHEGHHSCIRLLWQEQRKQAIIIPDHNPQKSKRKIANPLEELQKLEKSISSHGPIAFSIYPGFMLKETTNPTYQWIRNIKLLHPQQKLSLLMGNDSFVHLTSWQHWQTLINDLHALYVVSRLDGPELTEHSEKTLLDSNPKLYIKYLGRHEFEHLASRDIRKNQL